MILGVKLDDYAQQLQPDTLGAYAEMGVRHLELLIADCDAAGPFLSADFARRMRALTARYGFTLSYHATPDIVPLLTAPRCRSAVYATLEDFFALMPSKNAAILPKL